MKKILIVLCVVCMVFSTEVVAFAFGGDIEPNNNIDEAVDLKYYELEEEVYGIVNANDDEDWFKFTSDTSGPCLFVLRYRQPYSGSFDADLYLYDKNGNEIMKGRPDGDDGAYVEDYYIRANQIYYLKVKYNSGHLDSPYVLLFRINS